MKFAEHLSAHITPEWRKQYINYEEMKAMLYLAVEEAPSAEVTEQEYVTRHFKNFDEQFFHYCDKELKKINTFYSEKLAEATRKFATLKAELKLPGHDDSKTLFASTKTDKKGLSSRKIQDLKLAFSEFYLSLILLQNYQTLNNTGFRKILKKHDKLLNSDNGSKWRIENVETSHFYLNKDIDKLIQDTEALVTNELEGGNRQKAMKRLRVPPLGEKQSPWITFKVGLFSGSFIILFIAVILSAIFHNQWDNQFGIAFRLYRGPLLIIEFIFLIGVNIYGWRSSGVNHVLIFELDPRNHLSEQHLMELAAIFGVIWALSLLSFLFSAQLSIPPFVNPLMLTVILLLFVLNPIKVFRHHARFWLIKITWRILRAPFVFVQFADFWLADQMNSLAGAFVDFHFLICFYATNNNWYEPKDLSGINSMTGVITGTIVACLPAWFRFLQCLRRYRDTKEAHPHLVNAGKYASSLLTAIFNTLKNTSDSSYANAFDNPYLYMWLICSFISSIYGYTWDIKMDWGLFDKNAGENKFLREEIVYGSPHFYYFGIIEDFILRFLWLVSYLLKLSNVASDNLLQMICLPMEVFRRFVWNFFRLENEHLNNCGKFRAVRDISVAPIDSSDQNTMLKMMDDLDGVVNRKSKKDKKKDEKKTILKEIGNEMPLRKDEQLFLLPGQDINTINQSKKQENKKEQKESDEDSKDSKDRQNGTERNENDNDSSSDEETIIKK